MNFLNGSVPEVRFLSRILLVFMAVFVLEIRTGYQATKISRSQLGWVGIMEHLTPPLEPYICLSYLFFSIRVYSRKFYASKYSQFNYC
jgi:hypothetical protein